MIILEPMFNYHREPTDARIKQYLCFTSRIP